MAPTPNLRENDQVDYYPDGPDRSVRATVQRVLSTVWATLVLPCGSTVDARIALHPWQAPRGGCCIKVQA